MKYKGQTSNLSESQKDQIVNSLLSIAEAAGGSKIKKTATPVALESREKLVTSLFRDPTGRGLKRIAYAQVRA